MRRAGGRASLVGVVLSIVASFTAGFAQERGADATEGVVTAFLRPLVGTPRSAAPWPVEITFRSRRTDVVSGRLELRFRDTTGLVMVQEIDPVAIAPGEQVMRYWLPPATTGWVDDPGRLTMLLHTNTREITLGRQDVRLAQDGRRSVAIAQIGAKLAIAGTRTVSLAVEPWLRGPRPEVPTMTTDVARLPVDALPAAPGAFLAFDVVGFDWRAFTEMSADQLAAFDRWLRAGGAAAIAVGDAAPATEAHAAWIRRVLPGGPTVSFVDGALDVRSGARPAKADVGYGRVALYRVDAVEPGDSLARSDLTREVVAWVWRLRSRSSDEEDEAGEALRQSGAGAQILRNCLPEDVRPIPIALLVFILTVFVVIIGPLDWWLFGRLGRRWLTWIAFPVTCAGFTFLMLAVSEAFLGTNDARRRLTIVDLDERGVPVRETELLLVFLGHETDETIDTSGRWTSEIVLERYEAGRFGYGGAVTRAQPLHYRGRPGGIGSVRRRMWKWAPVLFRSFRFGSDATPPDVDWDRVTRSRRWSPDERLPAPYLGLVRGGTLRPLMPEGSRPDAFARFVPILQTLTVWPTQGLFRHVSRVSPTGGDHLADLSIQDEDDFDSRIGIVAEPDGEGGWRVFRRLLGKRAPK